MSKSLKTQAVPPFFANTPDDTHCFQAVFRGILHYFLPDRKFSWDELDRMSAKLPGKATWPMAMLISLHEMDFDVVMIEGFDGHEFIQRGADYIADAFGKETADWQVEYSDIVQEQKLYQKMFDAGINCVNRSPDFSELATYLQRGYLLHCTVNINKLNGLPGYDGHSILVYDTDDTYVTLQDPGMPNHGMPAHENREIPLSDFESAWAYPTDKAKNFIAVKYTGDVI